MSVKNLVFSGCYLLVRIFGLTLRMVIFGFVVSGTESLLFCAFGFDIEANIHSVVDQPILGFVHKLTFLIVGDTPFGTVDVKFCPGVD